MEIIEGKLFLPIERTSIFNNTLDSIDIDNIVANVTDITIEHTDTTISIYGIKEENEYTFKFSTKTVATIPFSVRYVEDESLDVGTEKVKQKGTNGLKTETYITKMLNGKVISTKLLSRDTYDAMERIIIKGTKSANNKTINVTEGTTESVESSTNTTEEKRPETTPSGNKTTTETNTTPTTESKE